VGRVPVDLFYGDPVNGPILFAGFTAEDACNEVPPRMARAKVFERSNGTLTVRARRIRGVDLFLYEFEGDPFELINATCEAMFDGDPTTQPIQPFAVGNGRVNITLHGLESLDDIGGYHVANTTWGTVTADDGTHWRVRGNASFNLDDEGFPIGDPADFQGLRVREIRHGQ